MKKFKYLYLLLLGVICGLSFSACSYDDDDYDAPNFEVLTPELAFDGVGGTQTLSVRADAQPTVSVTDGADWCSVAYADETNGTYNYNVTVSASNEDAETTATIRVIQGYSRKDVTITRAKKGEVVVPDEPASSDMSKTAMEVAQLMYPGWNLGNTMEAGDSKNLWTNAGGLSAETSWQSNKTTQELIDAVKAAGFKSVRIPCAWVMGHLSDADNCTIDAEWTKRVKEVVDYCIKNGLYVIINQHWDGGWIEHDGFTSGTDLTATKDKLNKIWTQIANNFKSYDEHLIFAGMNEPGVGGGQGGDIIALADMTARLAEYEQTFINAVRATGGNNAQRVLIVQGPYTNIDNFVANNYMSKITDTAANRLMVEVHFYDPYVFTDLGEDQSWGKYCLYWGKNNTGGDAARTADSKYFEDYVEAQMAKMKTNFFDKGYPVLIGEFGANQRTAIGKDALHDNSVKDYYKAVVTSAINNGCVPVAWDTNAGLPSMTIFKRSNATVSNNNMLESITAGVAAATWPSK